jgi:hypothetical protein
MGMASPATYNRQALGKIWNLPDLPVEWPGYQVLLQGDLDQDLVIDEEELAKIDWLAFSQAVEDFQNQAGLAPADAKLGPTTLRRLREHYGLSPAASGVLKRLGPPEMVFRTAEVPVSQPPGPPLAGHTPEERSICSLWNKYGKAIAQQASHVAVPVETALAVFYVESKTAYDPATGLVIIRFEPHIFERKTGQALPFKRGGQREEWDNLERAYRVNPQAALLATSYGLPQLMGFNWQVTRHPGVREMVLAFQRSCEEQVAGFFAFIAKNHLIKPILQEDWQEFARRYNGPGNVATYSGKLVRAIKVVRSLKEDGACFTI